MHGDGLWFLLLALALLFEERLGGTCFVREAERVVPALGLLAFFLGGAFAAAGALVAGAGPLVAVSLVQVALDRVMPRGLLEVPTVLEDVFESVFAVEIEAVFVVGVVYGEFAVDVEVGLEVGDVVGPVDGRDVAHAVVFVEEAVLFRGRLVAAEVVPVQERREGTLSRLLLRVRLVLAAWALFRWLLRGRERPWRVFEVGLLAVLVYRRKGSLSSPVSCG